MEQLNAHPLARQDRPESAAAAEGPPEAPRALPLARRAARINWRLALSGLLLLAGIVAFLIGWLGVSGTTEVHEQLPYFLSGGGTGLALIILAVIFFVDFEHWSDRQWMAALLQRLEALEELVGVDAIASRAPDAGGGPGQPTRPNVRRRRGAI